MGERFESTAWSVIAAAQGTDDVAARNALQTLCQRYWLPLYGYLRRNGHARETAEDLTQGFFTHLLARDLLQQVAPERGRFRTFLLACLRRFLMDEWDRQNAAKRGGGIPPLALDFQFAEERYALLEGAIRDPRVVFDRQWAEALLDTATRRLEAEYREAGKLETFEALRSCLGHGEDKAPYGDVAERLGTSEGAVRVAVHRMRKRFAALTREEIAQTVEGEEAVREELAYLIQVMSG